MNDNPAFDKVSLLRLAFNALTEPELQEMAALTRISTYPPEHVLCHEGAYEDVFYIIASGSAVICKKVDEEGGERTLRVAGKGDLVGEMALIQNVPRSATVRTISDCTVLEMDKIDFEVMLRRSPSMAINIIRITLDRIRENDRIAINDLQHTNKVLHNLDRNKLEFIQVAAHELRTPLTVLKGYVNVLRSLPDIQGNATVNEVISGINKGADRMHEVVNMMLDVTRIDNEAVRVSLAVVSLKGIIADTVPELAKAAEERKITIIIDQDENLPTIKADPSLIQKALYHLIVNAIKFTPDGGKVFIRSYATKTEKNAPAIEVSIRDTGIGLDREHHELVFEKFYQVGDSSVHSSGKTTFKGGGPGLGLAIVYGVAKAHGGKTWVESPGHDEVNFPGSTFYLQLPLEPPI
jgi:signal transduction histidine kinase